MHWEVEQKFRMPDDRTLSELAALGVQFSPAFSQCDRYFNHPARDFAATDEALRIRQVGSRNYLTYKGPKIDLETKTRQELELPLADGPEAAEQMTQVLLQLGFQLAGIVRKSRRTGILAW